jgi:hypothetical protein
MTKLHSILADIRFGGDVAENDDKLDRYFIETSSFRGIVDDQADLVLGPKGSGKTAIFRRLSNPEAQILELNDTDIVPAFNTQGSVIFRKLTTDLPSFDENLMRTVWLAYVLALLGNYLLDTYDHLPDTRRLRNSLTTAGLVTSKDQPKSAWNVIMDGLRNLVNPSNIEGALSFGDSGVPIITGKATFSKPTKANQEAVIDLEDILSEALALLNAIGRRCWVVFDRLDEAFQHDRDLERVALRGLLRAHLDIASYGRTVRTKLFLRSDVLDRITEQSGFVNATHMRARRITWTQADVANLIVKRVFENETFRKSFPSLPDALTSNKDRHAVSNAALPDVVEGQLLMNWIIQRTMDSQDEPNPRNVITLLEAARQRQLRIYERDDPDFDWNGPLIRPPAMVSGFKDLSKIRLADTLIPEFNHVRPYIERFRSGATKYGRPHLVKVLGFSRDTAEFSRVVDDLVYSGLLRASGESYVVVPLYRPALDLRASPLQTLEPAREDELRDIVLRAIEDIRSSGEVRILPPMKPDERRVVHEFVKDIPDITSATKGVAPRKKIILLPTPSSDEAEE